MTVSFYEDSNKRNMKKRRILYTIQVVLNILCVILYSVVVVKNYMSDSIVSMILNIVCVFCWIFCAVCNSIQLAKVIKKEKQNGEN